jgi:sugar/nucleoside kinase (ribokinase family)
VEVSEFRINRLPGNFGAGDTFNGRLLYGIMEGESILNSVEEAVALATRVVKAGRGVLGAFG